MLSLSALLSGVAILVLGNGLQGTLLGVRAGIEGMAAETIGLIMSAYFVGFAVACFVVPPLVERVGHIRTFAALASIASAVALAHAIFVTAGVWILLRIAQGACYAGLIMVIESWLNASTSRRHRGRVLATYSVVLYAAWALSQPMLSVAPPSDFVLFCIVSICLSLALVPITLMGSGGPGFVTASRTGLRRLYQISPLGLVGALAVGAVTGALLGMGPTFAQNNGLSDFGISAFMGLTIGGALALQWPLGTRTPMPRVSVPQQNNSCRSVGGRSSAISAGVSLARIIASLQGPRDRRASHLFRVAVEPARGSGRDREQHRSSPQFDDCSRAGSVVAHRAGLLHFRY